MSKCQETATFLNEANVRWVAAKENIQPLRRMHRLRYQIRMNEIVHVFVDAVDHEWKADRHGISL